MSADGHVTDHEYVMPDGEVIVTRTDPDSRITYANQAFLDSSGYSLEECMGQPQNIVRHPDMPKEAFADLWRTIRARKPWTGLVKNRRKNGGFYWVRANVTPIIEGGAIVGYMSVRVKPSRALNTRIMLLRRSPAFISSHSSMSQPVAALIRFIRRSSGRMLRPTAPKTHMPSSS